MAENIAQGAASLADKAAQLAAEAQALAASAADSASAAAQTAGGSAFMYLLIIFVLAVFVGFYVVWSVTPALHSPLMAVTNAVSSVIIVGALLAAGPSDFTISTAFGFIAVVLASVNIFGGFLVTQRMLSMFKKKEKK